MVLLILYHCLKKLRAHAIPLDPAGHNISWEDEEDPFAMSSNNIRVLVVGNMNIIYNELKKTIEGTIVYEKYLFNIYSRNAWNQSFCRGTRTVLGGQRNSLLQRMSTPKSNKTWAVRQTGWFFNLWSRKNQIFSALNVASYNPEYLNKFGVLFAWGMTVTFLTRRL